MTTSGTAFDFFTAGALPAPVVSAAEAEAIAADRLGRPVRARSLGSQQDANFLLTAPDGAVVGTLQLTVIPGLSRGGALRGQIEAVRVHSELRGRGLGGPFVRWAIDEARRRGCAMVQLTTDRSRVDAHRFYARLGFVDSHIGMKLDLRG